MSRKRKADFVPTSLVWFGLVVFGFLLGLGVSIVPDLYRKKPAAHFADQCFHVMDETGVHIRCEPIK
ncbi:MAG: hypothetical protein LAP61_05510 [Acidobacteriia bacterium]|nr:hypothetical protein [Terriglobia bacterium]